MHYQSYFKPSTSTCSQKTVAVSETEHARAAIRQSLVANIRRVIEDRGMTHTEASFETRVGRTVITAILNGNLDKISTDRLIRIAHRLGLTVELKTS